ncbi:UNVERIFIED_CONTAM: hypothetical protein RMT77_016299 [Armadillidium vulgare]
MSEIKINAISKDGYTLGEGPHWNEEDQTLIFVDILHGNIHRYFLQTQRMQNAHIDDGGTDTTVSFIIPVEGAKDTFVIGLRTSVAIIKWSPTEPDNQIIKPIPLLALDSTQAQRVKFNDAKCDNKGRLYVGTMDTDFQEKHEKYLGSLYSIDSDVKISRLETNIKISNGLAWSRDKKTFYYIDTMEHRIDAFDYSFETGVISNRRPVFVYKSHPEVKGIPDGMSIDENDNLWVACFNGFQVLNIDPREGKLLRVLDMPARNIISTCWGGPDYSTLFVTSAKLSSENDIEVYPETGKTFAVTGLGVKGLSPKKFKVNNLSKFIESKL